jgi:Lipase
MYDIFPQEEVGLRPPKTHLIGHSLGAHTAGYAGSAVKGWNIKLGRITGKSGSNIKSISVQISEKNVDCLPMGFIALCTLNGLDICAFVCVGSQKNNHSYVRADKKDLF